MKLLVKFRVSNKKEPKKALFQVGIIKYNLFLDRRRSASDVKAAGLVNRSQNN
jgi:hypothetical protein